MQKVLILFIIASLNGPSGMFLLSGQEILQGRVIDAETGEPLPFVNIVFNQRGTGTTTSLDGYFSIDTRVKPEFLKLSYVGYEPVTIFSDGKEGAFPAVLSMKRKPYLIDEVTVRPGINPAHRIIEEAFKNRRQNDPERLSSFTYTSYNKLFITLVPDSTLTRVNLPGSPNISVRFSFEGAAEEFEKQEVDTVDNEVPDSSSIKMEEFLEKQHLFLLESVSERAYLHPGRNNERVIASRVSGFKDPSFTLLATQLQSFSFYDNFISLLDRRYLNPISRGSTSRYSFILEDSMFTELDDTLYVISFRPYPNRNFDGLRGVVYINSRGYAVQNVIAEPAESHNFFTIRIQQNYTLVDNLQWFPAELNTDIIFGQDNFSAGSGSSYSLVGIGKSYLSDIKIEPELRRRDFNHVELTIDPNAHRQTESFWEKFRIEPLTEKDEKTYHVIDSIGEAANFDRSLRVLEAIATGYIPWGYVNVDYMSIIDFNHFEGLRPGLRLVSNDRFSGRFSLGGHVALGTRDKEIKYGAEAGLVLFPGGDMKIGVSYKMDVEEAGSYKFLGAQSALSTENYRRFNIGRMDYVEQSSATLSFRLMRHFQAGLYINSSRVDPGDQYIYSDGGTENLTFNFTESGLNLRFAYREKFMQTPKGNRISMGTDFPVLWVNYGRGLSILDGDYEYTRIQARLFQTFVTKSLGTTSFVIEGGLVDENVPLQKLYTGKGNYRHFSLDAANSFATMRMLEFASSEFVSFYFRQNFESLLFRSGNFRPELVFITNIGYGLLKNSENHQNISLRSMERGYFESGVLLNNIISRFIMGYGIGVYYRYGPYSFDRTFDNFAFKLAFSFNLR
jgi:hypothetical protein